MSSKFYFVTTKYGAIRGHKRKSFMGEEFLSFQGIPYAKPPIGDLRFRDPVAPEPWITPMDCTKEGPCCYSLNWMGNMEVAPGSNEDCLHINVYTKDLKPRKPLPVMVWIHGGAFKVGSSSETIYSPDYLLQKDIIFVSFNYRLGAFGFLSLDNPSFLVPGNAGLKDQTMALKWVRENIQQFGGDANNITVFGESAGGASVHHHMISNLSRNLFDKAIVMSGSVFNFWACIPRKNYAERLAMALGWNPMEENQNVLDEIGFEILKNASATEIVLASENLLNENERRNRLMCPFVPVIEPYESEQCFLSNDLITLSRNAWSANIPILIGGTAQEGLFEYRTLTTDPRVLDELGNFEYIIPFELGHAPDSDKALVLGNKLKQFYFPDEQSPPSLQTIDALIDVMTDKLFWHGIHRVILSRISIENAAPTYLYRFDFDSTFSFIKSYICGKNVPGACHGDDICYLFKNVMVQNIIVNSDVYKTINRMVGIWTMFALTGNPNDEVVKPFYWQPVKSIDQPFKCLNISNELSVIDLPETKRMALWDSLYEDGNLY